MITDIRVCEVLNAEFHNEFLIRINDKLNVSFSMHVLQTKIWSFSLSMSSFVAPKQLIPCTQYVNI